MPPKRNLKSQRKEDLERKKKILSAKERVLAKKNFIMKIIENMIEEDVSEEWFLSNCIYLSQGDFDDVVQERSIESKEKMFLCGFPLCSNITKQTIKQKYRISQATNKVYDQTERKYFCSKECFKASNYVKAQLSEIPLWMRKEEKIKVHLLSECDNKGSAGEEIVFHHKISHDEIYKVYSEETSNNLQNLLNEEVKKWSDSLSGLQIKEHLFEKQYVFSDETSNKSSNSSVKDKNASGSESELDSDDSIDEKKLFPSYDNESALSNRHMPIPDKMKKSVLIPPQNPEIKSVSQPHEISLHFARKVFRDWMTEDTLKYLLGEKHIYGVKADHLFKTMTESEFPSSSKFSSIRDEYIKLCLKIDSLPDEDEIHDCAEINLISDSDIKSNPKTTENENNPGKRVFKRRPRKSKDKNKHVTFASVTEKDNLQPKEKNSESLNEEKVEISPGEKVTVEQETKEGIIELSNEKEIQAEVNKNNLPTDAEAEKEPPSEDLPDPEPAFPLVDSVSQNILRRQVLTKKLKSVYTEILPVVGLHYTDIREDVRKFVDSLSLTPTNIIYKPKEWKLISLVLFRMLTRTVLKNLHDELKFAKLCEDPLMPIAIDLREIENLVCELCSAENITRFN